MAKAMLGGDIRQYDKNFRDVFFTEWNVNRSAAGELHRETDIDGVNYTVGEMIAGMSTAPQKGEGSQYNQFAPKPGKDMTIGTDIYKFAFRATEEMRDYGRFNQPGEYARLMAQIMDHTTLVQVYNLLNRAFSAAHPTKYDATELCSVAHPLAVGGGATASNRLAVDADLTETSLEALIELMLRTTNEDGVYTARTPKYLVTSTSSWGDNIRLTGSTQTTLQGAGESGNAINAVTRAYNLVPHFSPLLTDPDASFLMAERSPLNLVWTRRPELKAGYLDVDTDDWVWKIKAMFLACADTWRGIAGTPGA